MLTQIGTSLPPRVQAHLVKRSVTVGGVFRVCGTKTLFADAAARLADLDIAAVTNVFYAATGGGWELGSGTGRKPASFSAKDAGLCQRSSISV